MGLTGPFWAFGERGGCCGGCGCGGVASFAYWHAVFVGEVGGVDFVAVGDHGLVCYLLLWGVVDGVVPLEAQALDRESVFDHARKELVVDDVAEHGAVAVDQVLEDFEVSLRL